MSRDRDQIEITNENFLLAQTLKHSIAKSLSCFDLCSVRDGVYLHEMRILVFGVKQDLR